MATRTSSGAAAPQDPVHRFEDGPTPFWAVTKHADIMAVGKHPENFLSGPRL